MTQRELGAPGCSAAYVSQIETGRRMPRSAVLEHLAEQLGVSVDELRYGRSPDLEARLELQVQEARKDVFSGRFGDGERKLRGVRKHALHFGLRQTAARAQETIALSLERRGDASSALAAFDDALTLWSESPPPMCAETVSGRARAIQMLGDVRYAIYVLESYLDDLERQGLDDPTARMRTYSTLVGVYFGAGMVERAIDAAHEALALEPLVDDPAQVAAMHLNCARSLLVDGHPEAALRSLARAESLYTRLQRRHDVAYSYIAQGIVRASEGQYDYARESFEEALESLDAASAKLDRARTLTELARVERLGGDVRKARELLHEAVDLLQNSDVGELALAHRELGLCALNEDRAEAEKHLWQAIDLYGRCEDFLNQASIYRLIGETLRKDGDVLGALDAYRAGLELAERAHAYPS